MGHNPGVENLETRYLTLSDIREVHVEPTSKCQCLCPQCARAPYGKLNRNLPLGHLPLSTLKRFFTPALCQNLTQVYFCGNFGDPNLYPDLHSALMYLREHGVKALKVFTNGTSNSPEWWTELAQILHRPTDQVVFSIDGLEDTNSRYRINANWQAILANVRAFISAGGQARWEFLIFEHNKHQVHEAIKLAADLGFKQFKLKKTKRFTQGDRFANNSFTAKTRVERRGEARVEVLDEMHVENVRGSQLEMSHEQERVDQQQFNKLLREHGTISNYFAETDIQCKYKSVGSLFLDFAGAVWPCCWLAAPKYVEHRQDHTVVEYENLIRAKWGSEFNSVAHFSLSEILDHPWFKEKLMRSWTHPDKENPRLSVCGRTCGKKMDFSSGFRNSSNALSLELTALAGQANASGSAGVGPGASAGLGTGAGVGAGTDGVLDADQTKRVNQFLSF